MRNPGHLESLLNGFPFGDLLKQTNNGVKSNGDTDGDTKDIKQTSRENIYNVKILHLNVRSLRNKIEEVEAFLEDPKTMDYNILCFTEHHLTEDEISVLKIKDFKVISSYARIMSRHGGSIILTRPLIKCNNINDLIELSLDSHFELSAIEIKEFSCIILTLYRSPDANFIIFLDRLSHVLDIITGTKFSHIDHVVLNGDFNVLFNGNSHRKADLVDLLLSYNLEQQIFQNTNGTNCIDNIFVNFSRTLPFATHVFDPRLSDHCAIDIKISIANTKEEPRYLEYRPLTNAGMYTLVKALEEQTWDLMTSKSNKVDEEFDAFFSCFTIKHKFLSCNS